jgi:hypothetical protein
VPSCLAHLGESCLDVHGIPRHCCFIGCIAAARFWHWQLLGCLNSLVRPCCFSATAFRSCVKQGLEEGVKCYVEALSDLLHVLERRRERHRRRTVFDLGPRSVSKRAPIAHRGS